MDNLQPIYRSPFLKIYSILCLRFANNTIFNILYLCFALKLFWLFVWFWYIHFFRFNLPQFTKVKCCGNLFTVLTFLNEYVMWPSEAHKLMSLQPFFITNIVLYWLWSVKGHLPQRLQRSSWNISFSNHSDETKYVAPVLSLISSWYQLNITFSLMWYS